MKAERNILIAFILNFLFSIGEFVGGLLSGSVAILSDAIHDMGDAFSIAAAYFLEKKSKKPANNIYSYGYGRYSVLAAVMTSGILVVGSVVVCIQAVNRLFHPGQIRSNVMLLIAAVGVCVNGCAAFFTREKDSLNQKSVNLHMLEDMLGWIVVLIGSVVIHFTGFTWIDPVLSIGVAAFILWNALQNLKEAADIFLEKTPRGVDAEGLEKALTQLEGVEEVHHIHLWTLDGQHHCATMHIVTGDAQSRVKGRVREVLAGMGIVHATLEMEAMGEDCPDPHCYAVAAPEGHCHHHHHHHHHHH